MIEILSLISFDRKIKTPLYIQLFEKLKLLIDDGTLVPDLRLPSVRLMTKELSINSVTVVNAIKELEKIGYVYTRPGSGSFVANNVFIYNNIYSGNNNTLLDEVYLQDDSSMISNGQISVNESTINFASATPTPDLFPVDDFKIALNEVLERDKGNAFSYQDSQGFYPLRDSISEILKKSSINCCADDIQIISGAQQGIDLISKAILKEGDYVITESPTYTGAIAVFKSRGAQIADIELFEDGFNINLLEYTIQKYKPKLLYTIPTFQNPTGFSFSNQKRAEMIKLAEKYNFYIIEDDYVSDLDFEQKSLKPIKSIDKSDRVIFIKSYSKIFMPGLRLGFMLVPKSILGNVIIAKHATDISTSGLIQRAFDIYIRNSFWDKHSQFMYKIYKSRYLNITSYLDRFLPDSVTYKKPGGGLNIWLSLPLGFSISKLSSVCASQGVVFAPGRIFYSSNSSQKLSNIRLSFASVYDDKIEYGIKNICQTISLLQQKNEHFRNLPIL